MGRTYSVFGLELRANEAIPGLADVAASFDAADVDVYFGLRPDDGLTNARCDEKIVFTSSVLLPSGEPAVRIFATGGQRYFRFEYWDGVEFWVGGDAKEIWAIWPESSSQGDAATYLLGPVLGFVLRLRGMTCLHASAVALGNYAVAFAGCEGAGKSTTAAALARRGHAVISDDIVTLREQGGTFSVFPAYPYLCLWPESVNMIYGSDKALPAFSPNFDKRQLSLAENSLRFEKQPLPLGAVFLLGERRSENRSPFVEKSASRESLLALIAHSYATGVLDADMRAQEFGLLGRLVAAVPIFSLHPHQDGGRLDRMCELIERVAADPLRASLPTAAHA